MTSDQPRRVDRCEGANGLLDSCVCRVAVEEDAGITPRHHSPNTPAVNWCCLDLLVANLEIHLVPVDLVLEVIDGGFFADVQVFDARQLGKQAQLFGAHVLRKD